VSDVSLAGAAESFEFAQRFLQDLQAERKQALIESKRVLDKMPLSDRDPQTTVANILRTAVGFYFHLLTGATYTGSAVDKLSEYPTALWDALLQSRSCSLHDDSASLMPFPHDLGTLMPVVLCCLSCFAERSARACRGRGPPAFVEMGGF
jgi:hypothetical protein